MESTKRDVIYQGNSIISIELLEDYPHLVVIKKHSKQYPARRNILALEKEFEMTRSLDTVEGVRKALEQRSIENQTALILEYIDGETLQDSIARKILDLRARLEIAVDLARILGKIHRQNIVHLDLNSKNVLIGNKQQAVHIIDLGTASRIDSNSHQKVRPDQMLGTLPYISPEQTGRINREVDERSDLYSLGVVLYELMTRQLPFDSKNPTELIHQHIAQIPVSPSELSSEIPEMISAIILKLLKKNAEDRYQSATGVQDDLETCLRRLKPVNTIEEFPLGETDYASRLRFPQKLYGRENELKELENAFDSACRESSLLIFVTGFSGIGKTSLVEEIQQPVSEKQGYFIKGKFDQYLRTTPYTAITQAFAAFVSQILAETEKNFNKWQEGVQSAVGNLGKVLTEVVPALEELIGVQPDVPQLGGQEAENRFYYVFINFLQSVATEEHPLVLFIDDLQWIDAASLRLLSIIRSEFNQPGLLVIGAFRDNEVDTSHPLMEIIDNRDEKGTLLRTVKLENLQQQNIEILLSDTLRSQKSIKELGGIIYEKSLGNPFFSRRLLTSLNDEGRIRYDSEINRWQWNIRDIDSEAIADNVADLLAKKISQSPEEVKNILTLAACIGNRFDSLTLAMISGLTEQEVIKLLTKSYSGQYVFELGDSYEFVHDQVQQAAYTLIEANSRISKHLEIGRLLLANSDETELEKRLFDIVDQYNLGTELLTDRAEIIQLAELNLQAGRKSKTSSAFSASAEYLRQSASLLDENDWQDNYQLTLDVYNELIEACYLDIQYDEVKVLFRTVLDHVKLAVDLWVAYKAMIMSNVAENSSGDAIELAEGYLKTLHISFDAELTYNLSIEELYNLGEMEDQEMLAGMEILMAISTPIIFSAPERLPSLFYTMLNIISQYGNSEISSFAVSWNATLLCLEEQYQEGNAYGQLAEDLLNKFPSLSMAPKVMNMQNAWVRHWERSVHGLTAPLKEYHHIGMQAGEFEWSLYCLGNYTLLLWGSGTPLRTYAAAVEECIGLCESKKQEVTLLIVSPFAQAAANLTEESPHTTRLEGRWFSEQNMLKKLEGNPLLLTYYRVSKMTLCYLFGDFQEAYQHVSEVLEIRFALNPNYLYTKISFIGGLSCIAGLEDAENDADRQERWERLEQFERELQLWAQLAPVNYQHEYDLVQAEKARVTNNYWKAVQFYEKAIKGAQQNQFVHEEALANELSARFWQSCGNDSIAEMYMHEARVLYHQWGASAKVSHLENRYPHWFKTRTIPNGRPDISGAVRTTITQPLTPIQLDLDGIISASQTLSSETRLDQLLIKMMELVMSNSGAAKAVLLLREGADWFVQARGDITAEKHDILLNLPFDPADSVSEAKLVPESVFHYCRRSKEVLVVGDARLDRRFAEDGMIQIHNIKSMACIPTLSQGKLKALLFLENRQLADVFTLERVEILKHLSSQFGVSVENALLYDNLNRKLQELQESEERYQLAVAGSNAGIWDWDIPSDTIHYSDRFIELLGYASEEFSNSLDEFWNRVHSDDYHAARQAVDRHLKEQVPYHIDYRLQTKSGEYRWFHARGNALWDEAGKAVRMSGSVTDITERKQVEEELKHSEERFRSLVERSPLAIEILTPEGQISQVNAAWMSLWGVNEEETAHTLARYNMLSDRQVVEQGIMPLVERAFSGQPVVLPSFQYDASRAAEEVGLEHIKARSRWIQCHLYSVKDANGEIEYVVNLYMDITELRQAEQEAREQMEALARVDRTTSMGQLTGSISHELNQPLTGILSNAQAAEMMIESGHWEKEEISEIMADIAADAKRAGDVIRNLRQLYREQRVEFLPIDINAIAEETTKLLHSEFIIKRVLLTTQFDSSIPWVNGNRIQIQQILVNLIMNASQAMNDEAGEDRQIHIATAYAADEVKVYVEDNGSGIDPNVIDGIFEPLATWKPGHTGMGLAISNSIVRAHGGRMWAENKPEGGARVGFTVPIIREG